MDKDKPQKTDKRPSINPAFIEDARNIIIDARAVAVNFFASTQL
jgi:hypothetical protein